jgi:pimeloyl-ACP methyl ester carboxylesterase
MAGVITPVRTLDVQSTDGVTIKLHSLGGTGDPLIICHATGFPGMAYAPMASYLTDHFDVWAIDFRGHGASTAPESGDFSWSGMAADLLACVKVIGGGPVFAIGHSMGGAAILLASIADPSSVRAAYAFEPIVFPAGIPSGGENTMSVGARRRRGTFDSKQAALDSYGSRPPLNQLRDDVLEAYVEYGFHEAADGHVELACSPEHEARTFEAEDKVTVDRMVGSALPLMVAAGRIEDEWSPAELAVGVAETYEHAVLSKHDELGHFGPLEAPEAVAKEALQWFASL